MCLDNNCKDIYWIILNDKIDFQNQNLKLLIHFFSKSDVEVADFDKSDFFFNQTPKLTFKFLKSLVSLQKLISYRPLVPNRAFNLKLNKIKIIIENKFIIDTIKFSLYIKIWELFQPKLMKKRRLIILKY